MYEPEEIATAPCSAVRQSETTHVPDGARDRDGGRAPTVAESEVRWGAIADVIERSARLTGLTLAERAQLTFLVVALRAAVSGSLTTGAELPRDVVRVLGLGCGTVEHATAQPTRPQGRRTRPVIPWPFSG